MESNIGTIIDDIVRENKIYRFASELQHTENSERKEMLRDILKKLHNDTNDKSEKAREEITKICIKINENQMKKKWFRLTQEQKIEQITKYYENTKGGETEAEKKIILDLLKYEKLENKFVEYDEKNGKIINIIYEKDKKTKPKKQSKKKVKEECGDTDSD
jgi:hypothetical protein